MLRTVGLALIASLTGCASVAVVGKRVDDGGDAPVTALQVYSFLPLHTMGSDRLHRDAKRFDHELTQGLSQAEISAIAVDVEEVVRRDGLAVEVSVADREGTRRTSVLPEREVLAAPRPEGADSEATHRLVILPARVTVDRSTGITHGVLHWRLEPVVADVPPIALGLIRYTADARGFPAPRMARELVAKLRALGVR